MLCGIMRSKRAIDASCAAKRNTDIDINASLRRMNKGLLRRNYFLKQPAFIRRDTVNLSVPP